MENPQNYILKQKHIKRHLVDFFTDEKKAAIYKAPKRVTSLDEITKLISINFWNVLVAKEDKHKQVCSILYVTNEKKYLFVDKIPFFPSILEKPTIKL